jgi:hypothetical protein
VLGDRGWWRTVTGNLDRLDHHAELVAHQTPPGAPKSPRWRMRARVGERKRRYELPEETTHPD